jgi:hypothetical protein
MYHTTLALAIQHGVLMSPLHLRTVVDEARQRVLALGADAIAEAGGYEVLVPGAIEQDLHLVADVLELLPELVDYTWRVRHHDHAERPGWVLVCRRAAP